MVIIDAQLKRVNANVKAIKEFVIYALFLALLSSAIKALIYDSFYFTLFIGELLLCLVGCLFFVVLYVRQRRNNNVLSNYLVLKSIITLTSISAIFVYALTAFITLKHGPDEFKIAPLLYTNVFILLLSAGAIFATLSNETSLHRPQLLLCKKDYINVIVKNSLYLVLLLGGAILFSLLLNIIFFRLENITFVIVALSTLFANVLIHYIAYSLYEWRRAREIESIENNKNGIVSKTLIIFVAFYAVFALIKDLSHIIFTLLTPNVHSFILLIRDFELLIFVYTTMLMIFVIFSVRKSLNNAYPRTTKFVNIAVTIWSIKLVNNGIMRINHELLNVISNYENTHAIINQTLSSIALVFNLALLISGLLIISKNTFPHLKLWLLLASVQVFNFAFNMSLPLWGDVHPGINLYTNFVLTIFKLLFVFLIIYRYQNAQTKKTS